jgi:hypothetical protein
VWFGSFCATVELRIQKILVLGPLVTARVEVRAIVVRRGVLHVL